jgi:hypothetical protein
VAGSRPWTSADHTGGPLDDILDFVRFSFPDAVVVRLVGTLPADDDNVFWVQRPGVEVKIDNAPGGSPPFAVEGAAFGSRLDTDDAQAAMDHLEHLLRAVPKR